MFDPLQLFPDVRKHLKKAVCFDSRQPWPENSSTLQYNHDRLIITVTLKNLLLRHTVKFSIAAWNMNRKLIYKI